MSEPMCVCGHVLDEHDWPECTVCPCIHFEEVDSDD